MKMYPLYVPENDSLSMFPHVDHHIVPTWLLNFLCISISIVILIIALVLLKFLPKYFVDFRVFTLIWVFVIVAANNLSVTEILKRYAGRPRPDVYAVCGNNTQHKDCTNVKESTRDNQYKSWPSGHSSTSMSTFYLVGCFIQNFCKKLPAVSSFVGLLFILLALMIGATRIRDFRHHTDDVLAGLFIGYLVAAFFWRKTKYDVFIDENKEGYTEA
ncbi:PAP2 superfamily protein [Histomonas meleagridis]|uniref:PAP2 superfamily protein n=1 Tax=Histomonas meleagridis TaxID=135588 RepID=UPI003559406C|nr:PAP2 superfamily protein [Histomonas meleagridis]KAH0803670.1 PAP2 superfamily protein [Histomonas meleagridis]